MKKLIVSLIVVALVFTVLLTVKYFLSSSKITDVNIPNISQKSLNLEGKGLNKIPDYVFNIQSLEILNVSNNNLDGAIQGEIRFLKNLKELNLSNNRLTGVPAEVGQLSKLEVLNISNNMIMGLPNELANLKNLKVLNLSGNNYSKQDLDIIMKGLPQEVTIIK